MSIRVSVIMPCYNVADTLERAINSILMQNVDFEYEIVAVDDCSTDSTLEMLETFADKYSFFRVIRHSENKGNAISFYDGLCASKGDYFCVLDGDDYYTLPNKFQKQVGFLDADVKEEYVGCCHYFVIDLGKGNVSVPDCMTFDEFNYTDFMTQSAGYFHTATHMYRNIFRGNVPEYFRQVIYRGDTPRTTFHLMFSGGKIKILNFVASAYVYTYEGIWSSMNQNKQFEYQINYLNHLDTTVTSPFEHMAVDIIRTRNQNMLKSAKTELRRYPQKTIEECLRRAYRYAQVYSFREKDYFLKGVYNSEYLDTLCASLGVVHRINHPEHIQKSAIDKRLAIMIWQLNPQGGGLFREVSEIIEMYPEWEISVIVTDGNSSVEEAKKIWQQYGNVEICKVPSDCEDTLSFLSEHFCAFQPEKLYSYCSHSDVFSVAAIQQGVCRNICLYSYDHGYLTGLENPFIDKIVAKRPVDYTLLINNFDKDRILYIPTWNIRKPVGELKYVPFKDHDKLITASCAARFYKVDGGWPYRYEDMIVALLKKSGGRHYHIGEISEKRLALIMEHLEKEGVSRERFVNIPWVDNLPQFMLENQIDVFVEPFPTVSYKVTLDMLSVGIPVIAFDAVYRMGITDFVYEGAMRWRSEEEFVDILCGVTKEDLLEQSVQALKYFEETHSFETIKPYIVNDESFDMPQRWKIADPNIRDIKTQSRLFLDCCRIQIMSDVAISTMPKRPGSETLPDSINKKMEMKRKADRAKHQKACFDEAEAIRQSATFKLGYAIMYVPRMIKLFLKTASKDGLRVAIREVKKPNALLPRYNDGQVEMIHYQNCTCLKLGRVIALPYRIVKKIYRMLNAWASE
ncbi:MAG: glycosyltransferase [Oscillospiraceae bacterium]|nr:glycosyltransferase [Clostridia bacterium]MBQ9167416.1 glycosyltransferase [Oscillospiraceae bacterium]